MKKEELKEGMIIETRYGGRFLKSDDGKYYALNGRGNFDLNNSTETLESLMTKNNDIMKVYEDYTCSKLLWERPEDLLTQEEKEYLKAVIKPFEDKVKSIMRYVNFSRNEYIEITFKDDSDGLLLPYIKNMTLKFKGLEARKEYTLKELGLEE